MENFGDFGAGKSSRVSWWGSGYTPLSSYLLKCLQP
jgi:hypothetical protein